MKIQSEYLPMILKIYKNKGEKMQHILRKRVWRNLKKKFPRYLALVAIITMSMYLIVSIVASSDTIILGA